MSETVVADCAKFDAAQAPGSVRGGCWAWAVLFGDVHEDRAVGYASGSFEPAAAVFAEGFANADFDDYTGVFGTDLPQSNVSLFLAVVVLASEIDACA